MTGLPLPPIDLARRVGDVGGDGAAFLERYQAVGLSSRDAIAERLPRDWSWEGKRVLDFGCGAGRTLRHFEPETRVASFSGCDIDRRSIDWLNANLRPPFEGFVNREAPPLDKPDDSFDLIYAMSVFTHITTEWSAWLVELHRLLAPGGVLVATVLGEGMSQVIAGEPWVEDRVGMNVLQAHRGWDEGGPMVLLSPWWIREHWGRGFELLELDTGSTPGGHGVVVATPREPRPSVAEFEAVRPDEPREITALRHNVVQLQREAADAGARYEASLSWKLTRPLRSARAAARARLR